MGNDRDGSRRGHLMILESTQHMLETAGYGVVFRSGEHEHLLFEDSSLLGLVCLCPSGDFIIDNWRQLQDGFLRETAQALRSSPEKAWNTYLVLLTAEVVSQTTLRKMAAIEEDFGAMRKIVTSGVLTAQDVEHALGPLLPLRSVTVPDDNLLERLRIAMQLSSAAFDAIAASDVDLLTSILLEEK